MSDLSSIIDVYRTLAAHCERLPRPDGVAAIYNPLIYARRPWERYLTRFAAAPKRIVYLGMNPGPWGMAQTGVPFGEVAAVRDWMGIVEAVDSPEDVHPKRPIQGFSCPRSEVSGRRLWGLFAERCSSAATFFADQFVLNYCPLVYMETSGRNLTPDKLPVAYRNELYSVCDAALRDALAYLNPEWVIGIGAFARNRLERLEVSGVTIGQILHPSPASPRANRGWAQEATRQLQELSVWS